MKSLKAVTLDQAKYFNTLFNNFSNKVEVRTIDKKGAATQTFLSVQELMQYESPQDKNVYAGIYERLDGKSGAVSNCSVTNAIFLDFDGISLEALKYTVDVKKAPLPTMIVDSGRGYHAYWKLNKSIGHELQPIIKALAELLGADMQATDIARILRIPDTFNIKEDKPLKVSLTEINNNAYDISLFEGLLDVKAAKPNISIKQGSINELKRIKQNGLHNMAAGVKKGSRNFAAGRIVQTLKRLNYTKQEIKDIVFRWNRYNKPEKSTIELEKEINVFYHDTRYKYDGKSFEDKRLQLINESFLTSESIFFTGGINKYNAYDNELLHPETFRYTSGLTFAILAVIKLAESDGIRREHIADLVKRHKEDKNLKGALKSLQAMDYLEITVKNQVNYYRFIEKSNYKRGYTTVGKSLHRSFIYKEISEPEYKLMILLESYAYNDKKEVYPMRLVLALSLGQSDRTVRRNLQQLEHKQFIKRELKQGKNVIRFIYR